MNMPRLIVFKNPDIIEFIREYIPGFDFNKGRTSREMQSIINVCKQKAKEKKVAVRKAKLDELGVKPGSKILLLREPAPKTVRNITKDGKVTLVGEKGSFNLLSIQEVLAS